MGIAGDARVSAPAFGPKAIFEYAFSRCEGLPDASELSKKDLGRFLDTLQSDILSDSERPALMRYVWVMGQRDEEEFLAGQGRFLDFGDRFVCTDIPGEADAERIEHGYEETFGCDVITRALRHARLVARQGAMTRMPDGNGATFRTAMANR